MKRTPDSIIAEYKEVFKAANPGKYLALEHWSGWYTMYTGGLTQHKYRGKDLLEMAQRMRDRIA